jgi:hypothetical protein
VAEVEEKALLAAKSVEYKRQLVVFYEEHNPEKIDTVDKLLEDFTHEAIAASLQKVYGKLPGDNECDFSLLICATHCDCRALF